MCFISAALNNQTLLKSFNSRLWEGWYLKRTQKALFELGSKPLCLCQKNCYVEIHHTTSSKHSWDRIHVSHQLQTNKSTSMRWSIRSAVLTFCVFTILHQLSGSEVLATGLLSQLLQSQQIIYITARLPDEYVLNTCSQTKRDHVFCFDGIICRSTLTQFTQRNIWPRYFRFRFKWR